MASTPSNPPDTPADVDEIPPAPPPALRQPYLRLSWAYIYWCVGLLLWTLLCVAYFVLTHQRELVVIGLCLGALVIVMTLFPAVMFGGPTWHKRLGWITVLLFLSAVMFLYPIGAIVVGVVRRVIQGRYRWPPYMNDVVHLALALLTVGMSAWTVRLTVRAGKLVRRLSRGEYEG